MRFSHEANGVRVRIIAGTYVVILAIDATESAKQGLLGFAISRKDKTEGEEYWLQGMRTFKSVYPNPPEGALVSTHEHPIQDFLWSDFTAKPNHEYVYEVLPVRGVPKNLKYGTPVVIENVTTESADKGTHSIYFNRGVIGSQAYARKFHNTDPRKLKGQEQKDAYGWLSRGLFEAMRDFIRQAKSTKFGLRAAVYEFSYEPIIAEFRDAQKRSDDVQIIYDARIKKSHGKPVQEEAKRVALTKSLLKKYGLSSSGISKARVATPNAIAHNKFIVLLEDDQPVSVWTGSTNFTESGIFGQSNVGHIVRDERVAGAYLQYWKRLYEDPEVPDLREQNNEADPDLHGFPPPEGITPIFSPRMKDSKKQTILNWYATAMGDAKKIMCFTAAFGINQVFLENLQRGTKPDDDLRYLFLESWGTKKELAAKTEAALKKNRNNVVAVGGYLKRDVLHQYLMDRWREERSNPLSSHVRYTHTKYMVIDPLGKNPIIISGSANFSDASTNDNDENMLVIAGDERVADIYLGEFMRLWHHYRFRSIVNEKADESGHQDGYEPNYLCEDESWTNSFYKDGTFKCKRRVFFME